jgi:hypothetical protein
LRFELDLVLVVSASVAAATPISGKGVFSARFVAGVSYVALSITRFVSLEVVESLCAALGQRSMVAVARVIAVIDVAIEAAMAMEPRAGANEDSAKKPVGAIVAVGGAVVGSVVEVAIGAYWRHSNVDADGNLGWAQRRTAEQGNCKS